MNAFSIRSLVLAAMILPTAIGATMANSLPAGIDRVEEDWELVIAQPDLTGVGPQITTVMSPTGNTDQIFAFNLNYRERPEFDPGGLQVRAYNGKTVAGSSTQGSAQLATPDEVVTWTQSMSLSGGTLHYSVDNGQSQTWNLFGQGSGANLNVSVGSSVGSLDGYDPNVSVTKSGASWQPNRVTSMRLLGVRYFSNNQLVEEIDEPREVRLVN